MRADDQDDREFYTRPAAMTSPGRHAALIADLPGDWHPARQRWLLTDAQIDGVQLGWFPIGFDLADVPRDQFLIAGQAWRRIRAGEADPARFGLSQAKEAGDWWSAGNLMRDGAALLNTELLPWDCWGAMPGPDDPIDADLAALFDRLAELTLTPEVDLDGLRRLYSDERLRVPATVFNAVLRRDEPLWPDGPPAG